MLSVLFTPKACNYNVIAVSVTDNPKQRRMYVPRFVVNYYASRAYALRDGSKLAYYLLW